jgi:putative peptide zinc metalloprotease protein
MVMMVLALPRLLATAWDSVLRQQTLLSASAAAGDLADAALRVLAIAAVALPVLGTLYIVLRLARQLATGLWHKTRGKALQRGTAIVAAAAVVAGLAWAWWPDGGTYRPVQAYERGTLADATTSVLPRSRDVLREGQSGSTVALWPAGAELPTREKPQLSMVLVPAGSATATRPGAAGAAAAGAPSWVFPFGQPAAPEADGNQALAVNTTDGSVKYSVAFALVWAEDGKAVDTTNEAYAFASCSGCAAVAVGFQVVLIVGQADVIVPENLSAAANYNCLECLTYALASQLVLTLDGPLGEDSMARLNALWAEIAAYGTNIRNVPLSEIQGRLAAYKEQITAIIKADPSATRTGAAAATPAPTSGSTVQPSPGSTAPATLPPGTGAGTAPAAPPPTAQVTQPAPSDSPPSSAPTAEAPAESVETAPAAGVTTPSAAP